MPGELLFLNDPTDLHRRTLALTAHDTTALRPVSRMPEPAEPPLEARIAEHARVVSSWIAPGADIEGTVEGSVVFPGASVRRGAHVVNSVLMNGVIVGCRRDGPERPRASPRAVRPDGTVRHAGSGDDRRPVHGRQPLVDGRERRVPGSDPRRAHGDRHGRRPSRRVQGRGRLPGRARCLARRPAAPEGAAPGPVRRRSAADERVPARHRFHRPARAVHHHRPRDARRRRHRQRVRHGPRARASWAEQVLVLNADPTPRKFRFVDVDNVVQVLERPAQLPRRPRSGGPC